MRKIIIKLLFKLKILGYLNLGIKINNIMIPIIGGLGYDNINGTEKWMTEILGLLLNKSEGCFLDVGVNIGQTLLKVKSINPHIEYIGFEPNPVCVFYTEQLIDANKFQNIKIIPTGISNTNKVLTLNYFSDDITDSSASIVENFRPKQKIHQEKSIVVLNNDIIKIEKKISIIKIDVEGAELMVIEGIIEIFERDRPYILIEILPVYDNNNHDRLFRQNEILKIMNNNNYCILKIMKNSDDSLKGFSKIEDFGIHSDLTHCDYLFIPGEKNNEISCTDNICY